MTRLIIFLLILLGTAIYLALKRNMATRKKQKAQAQLQLVATAKLTVKTDECEIIRSDEYEEVERRTSFARANEIDALAGKTAMHVEKKAVSYIRYRHTFLKGNTVNFVSYPIYKERETLLFMLSAVDSLTIYYNPSDPSQHYFDLAFLEA